MKSFAIGFALLHLASWCYGAPGPVSVKTRREFESPVTFQRAGSDFASYTLTLPFDGSTFTINDPLSVSHIIADGPISGTCTFNGIDGSVTVLPAEGVVDVGPPQTLVSGTCVVSNPARRPRQVIILVADTTFFGAGPDPPTYNQTFITGGFNQTISNPLSVSYINISDNAGSIICTFFGINGSKTVVPGGETVDVGPPQAQVSAACEVVG